MHIEERPLYIYSIIIIIFLLEVVCINEDDIYLKALVAEMGYRLHSTAYCSYLQCAQFGLFNVKDALLSKHWDLQNILDNVRLCHKILKEHPYMLKQEYANLVQPAAEQEQADSQPTTAEQKYLTYNR